MILSHTDAEPGTQFAVDMEHRSSDKFDRLAVINAFVDSVPMPPHKVRACNSVALAWRKALLRTTQQKF
jgi:hypothetical protein